MDFQFPATKTQPARSIRVVAPFADMLNHSYDTEPCHVYDETVQALKIKAGKDYAVGDQVGHDLGTLNFVHQAPK